MEYRIKISERIDGGKQYTPQVMCGRIVGGWIKRFNLSWDNIIGNGCRGFYTASTIEEIYNSEKEALDVIEKYKEYLLLEESKKINKVSYKNIN